MPPMHTTPKISVQLYSVREALRADLHKTLKALAMIGFTRVEGFRSAEFPQLHDALSEYGLRMPSVHERTVSAGDPADWSATFATAAARDVELVIEPSVPAERWSSYDAIARIAHDMNAAAELATASGTRFGYHNHAHELAPMADGRTALEHLAEQMDERVALEIDVYWVMRAGHDPVALIDALGDRVVALHLKDAPSGSDLADQVPLGLGELPFDACIDAAPPWSLQVLEFDDTRWNIFDALEHSLARLQGRWQR